MQIHGIQYYPVRRTYGVRITYYATKIPNYINRTTTACFKFLLPKLGFGKLIFKLVVTRLLFNLSASAQPVSFVTLDWNYYEVVDT